MTAKEFKKKVTPQLPNKPGVYKFYGEEERLLYIGKAKNLKKRVSSYFQQQSTTSTKTKLLVRKTHSIDFTLVNSEEDALLLENSLIKKHQPKYNVMFRDDKTYPYICIKNERFPRVFATRRRVDDGSEYFGPYTSMRMVRTLLDLIQNIFTLRTCKYTLSEENINKGKFKVCLEYHIGNCKGPCEGLEAEENYNEKIKQIREILKGRTQMVIKHLKQLMDQYAEQHEFEKAHQTKEKIALLKQYKSKSMVVNPKIDNVDVFSIVNDEGKAFVNYLKVNNGAIVKSQTVEMEKQIEESPEDLLASALTEFRNRYKSQAQEIIVPFKLPLSLSSSIKVTIPKIGDKKKLLNLSYKNARYYKSTKRTKQSSTKLSPKQRKLLEQVQNDLNVSHLPVHIECIDNSNIQGSNPVAGLVVFKNGTPSKEDYRHFNIKSVQGPDDFASMKEVVYRRYRRLLEEERSLPQLLIVDGGKGQLNAALESLQKLELQDQIDIVAIAKRLEEIYVPNDPYPLYIDKQSSSLKLIQRIRNEAHRFAVNFHRHQRKKGKIQTTLTNIKGIGKVTAQKLLQEKKSVKSVKKSSKEELAKIIGPRKGELVYNFFHSQ